MSKFKVGDRVKILPSAEIIGVSEREIGKTVKIFQIFNSDDIRINDSKGDDYGCWSVTQNDIVSAIEVGQQLLLWDDIWETT